MDKKEKVKIVINSIIIGIIIISIIILTIVLWPFFASLKDPEKLASFQEDITSKGFGGVMMLLGLQIVQIIIPIIPGQIMEALSGVMYGPYIGTLICIVGVLIATSIIYGLVYLLGKPFVDLFISKKDAEKWKFLNDSDHVEAIFLFLFLLPAMPKDLLVYFAASIRVKLNRFLIISMIARIPSILLVAFFGDAIISGDIRLSIIMISIIVVISAIGIIFNKNIINWLQYKFITKKPKKND